jgi:hypothetical protein
MTANNPKTVQDVDSLREDISGLKNDVRIMERILMEADAAQGQKDDEEELKNIDNDIDEL